MDRYLRRSGLLNTPATDVARRRSLAAFMTRRAGAVIEHWMRDIGPALGIPEADWPRIKGDQLAAVERWARHVADPADITTYLFLRSHSRRGFISHFPASRFLASQMRFVQLLMRDVRTELADDPAQSDSLCQLLGEEFGARMLHITDFFVEGHEERLLEQEASYRRAIDHAPIGILMADAADGRIFDANQAAERIMGASRAGLAGRRLDELYPPAERVRAETLWRGALVGDHTSRDDLHVIRADGTRVPVFAHAGYIEYGNRHWVQLMVIDISVRKQLESQLVQSEKMAAIGQLAAGIAHELRNPLAIVMNALFDLRRHVDVDDPDVGEDIRIAEEEIGRAQSIIKNLLEFSRESSADVERVDINGLVGRTVQLMQKYFQDNGVSVTTDLAPIPPCAASGNAMRHILLNLLTNAVQAMPEGGALRLATGTAGTDRIRLEVEDTGVGIPAAHLKDIFNPFFTTKAPGQGTGLGLSVVHSIVERYRGEIAVTSTVGAGTRFVIELPCPCHDGALDGDHEA